ncbi:MAG: hypothetical protein EF813_06750 [Methanosarcinales archaeon]|nr:MAG: hypothetical protein EF813_06750 [Methanosarcinales archaeon]
MNSVRILVIATIFVFMLLIPVVVASGNDSYIFDNELQVNEGITIETSIHIEVVDVNRIPPERAKFRITSYQKPERTITVFREDGPQVNKYETYRGTSIYFDVIGVYSDSVQFSVSGPSNWRVTDYYDVETEEDLEEVADAVTVPKLKITRTLDIASVQQGQTVKVTFKIKNEGNGTASEIELDESTITGAYMEGCPASLNDIAAGATERVSYDLKIIDAEPGTYELNPTLLNYKSESGASYSSESTSNVLVIVAEEVLVPELGIKVTIESDDDVITCGDRFPAIIRIDNIGNATSGRVTIKSHLPDDVRVADGEIDPVYESIKPGDFVEYDVTMIAYEPGKHIIKMDVLWADAEASASAEFWAELSGFDKYYIYILAAIPIVLILLWLIKRRREYSF